MKTKHICLLLNLFLLLFVLFACGKDDAQEIEGSVPTEFTPSQETTIYFAQGIDFGANGGEQTVLFTCNKKWTAASTESWCTVSPDNGRADKGSFLIKVSENQSLEKREAVVTLKVGELNNYIVVRQGNAGSGKVHVEKAGTLSQLLASSSTAVTELTISGELNGTDFKFLKGETFLKPLVKLDLRNAKIVEGGEDYYFDGQRKLYTQNNEVTDYLFMGYQSLVSLLLPSTTISIGAYGISMCYELKNIEIPSTVIYIGNYAFYGCKELSFIDIPQGVTSIGDYTFSNTALKEITFPSRLESIGIGAFYGSSLEKVVIPQGVKKMGSLAFGGCSLLRELCIPASVEEIGAGCWSNCSNLNTLEIHTNKADWTNSMGCLNLNKIIIGEEVKEISSGSFLWYESLKSLHIKSATPPQAEGCFSSLNFDYENGHSIAMKQCTLYVPKGARNAYIAVGCPWTDFKEIIEE